MNLMTIVRNHTDLNTITTKKKEQKIRRNQKVSILVNFYKLMKTKIKKQIDNFVTEDLADTDESMTIIAPESCHPNWCLQELNVHV